MTAYRLVAEPAVDADVEAAFQWYEKENPGQGLEFLDELRSTYARVVAAPLSYRELRGGIRRALLRRFAYAVYLAVDGSTVVVLTVLHAHRDPAAWQRRGR